MKTFKLENETKIESGFTTPANYFENFSEKVMLQLPKEEPKLISLFQKRKTMLMMAAAVLVIALMIPIFTISLKNSKELDENTIETYLSYQSNMNQYDLINDLDPDDIDKIQTNVALEDKTIEDILTSNANLEHLILE
ncbi:hypothetical protein ACMDB5_08465 [Flavobacterium sp. W1B]|uniref:hypothetical protein n=1 Tax=Flavobacterium sp. W1B TaxID=3394146 RepID=UPI0039BD4101